MLTLLKRILYQGTCLCTNFNRLYSDNFFIFFSLVMQCEFWYTLMCPFSWMAGSNHLTFLGSAKVMMASTHMGGLLAAKKVIPSSHLLS